MKTSLPLLIGLLCACTLTFRGSATARDICTDPGRWLDPGTGSPLEFQALVPQWAERSVILLGESHTSTEDHAWQLQVLAALHGRTANMVIGFEAFPRRVQPVLDRWVAGELTRRQFLEQAEWDQVWGFPSSLYQSLFDFARMNRIPMVALNVERKLVQRVGKEGWASVPPGEREGLGDPASASDEYVSALAEVFALHKRKDDATGSEEAKPPNADDPAFRHFIEAQLTWDRAMAEALATARSRHPTPIVVGILGRGHVEYGYGVPHQLSALGVTDVAALVTWAADRDCGELRSPAGTAVADAVFVVAAESDDADGRPAPPRGPKLGVMLSQTEKGVVIDRVVDGSVAAATGLQAGDIVTAAAGRPVESVDDLATSVRRQPFGTWLPLVIRRNDEHIELVAKFPARPHPPMEGPSPHRHPQDSEDPGSREPGK